MHSNQQNKVYIGGLDKAELLIMLYNNAKVQGRGREHHRPDISIERARELIDLYKGEFEYLHGKVLKVNLSGDYLDTWLYNRDNFEGRAEAIVEELRKKQQVPSQMSDAEVEGSAEKDVANKL